jgi:hypothetical protein
LGSSESRYSGAQRVRIDVRNSYAKRRLECRHFGLHEDCSNGPQNRSKKGRSKKEISKPVNSAQNQLERVLKGAAKSAPFLHLTALSRGQAAIFFGRDLKLIRGGKSCQTYVI